MTHMASPQYAMARSSYDWYCTLNVATSETAQDEYEMYLKELEAGSKVTELERFDITKEEI